MSQDEPTEYRIFSLMDFIPIPKDRLDSCLLDFKAWIEVAGRTPKDLENMGFVWIDDGRVGVEFVELNIVNQHGKTMGTHTIDVRSKECAVMYLRRNWTKRKPRLRRRKFRKRGR